jgi:hypothetical protein
MEGMVRGMDDDPLFALIVMSVMGGMVAYLVHDVQRVQARKHGNGGLNDNILHGGNGRDEPLRLLRLLRLFFTQEVANFFRFQVHVVQKHGAQLEVHFALSALLLLLLLNAPDELLLAQDAVLNAHRFLAHVLYGAIIHEGVHYPKAALRLRVQQIVVQVQVQVQVRI